MTRKQQHWGRLCCVTGCGAGCCVAARVQWQCLCCGYATWMDTAPSSTSFSPVCLKHCTFWEWLGGPACFLAGPPSHSQKVQCFRHTGLKLVELGAVSIHVAYLQHVSLGSTYVLAVYILRSALVVQSPLFLSCHRSVATKVSQTILCLLLGLLFGWLYHLQQQQKLLLTMQQRLLLECHPE
jgi:hypothetical protein